MDTLHIVDRIHIAILPNGKGIAPDNCYSSATKDVREFESESDGFRQFFTNLKSDRLEDLFTLASNVSLFLV